MFKLSKLIAAAALASGAAFAQPAVAADLTLEFVVWNYSLETIQDNIKLFEAANPGIKVNVTDYTWPDYQDSIVLRFRGNTPTDVIYGGQDWLPAWGAAGFIAPLDAVAPADTLAALKADIAGFALTDVTYKDKVYGLPYYADTISFIYNKKILGDAGIAVPATWDEVTAAAEKLKAGGMEHPIVYEYNQELPELLRRLRRAGLWPRRRVLRQGFEPAVRRPRQRGLQAAAMAGRRLCQGAGAVGDA